MTWARTLSTWLAMAFLMSANGVLRESVFVPAFRRGTADFLSALSGIAVILAASGLAYRTSQSRPGLTPGRVALVWGTLTVAFEFAIGLTVDRKTVRELLENYAIWRGHLWPLVLLALVFAPFLWSRTVGPGRRAR